MPWILGLLNQMEKKYAEFKDREILGALLKS